MLSFNSKNDMGTSVLQFIFGQDLSEASWKWAQKVFKNSLRENISILDQRYKLPKWNLIV